MLESIWGKFLTLDPAERRRCSLENISFLCYYSEDFSGHMLVHCERKSYKAIAFTLLGWKVFFVRYCKKIWKAALYLSFQ